MGGAVTIPERFEVERTVRAPCSGADRRSLSRRTARDNGLAWVVILRAAPERTLGSAMSP